MKHETLAYMLNINCKLIEKDDLFLLSNPFPICVHRSNFEILGKSISRALLHTQYGVWIALHVFLLLSVL